MYFTYVLLFYLQIILFFLILVVYLCISLALDLVGIFKFLKLILSIQRINYKDNEYIAL
jgi:hypothetical protein